LAELKAKIAQRKKDIAEKKQKIAELQGDIKELKDTYQLKRCRELETCAARFNAYAEKLSKELKMDKDNW
jgi:archaellum component FlaC